jgi:hypothetical protein
MDFDSGTIERNMIDLNVNDVVFLQPGEDVIQDTSFGPTVCARINRVPITKFLGNPRHLQPCSATYKMALSTCKLVMVTLPRCFGSNFSTALNSFAVIFIREFYQH